MAIITMFEYFYFDVFFSVNIYSKSLMRNNDFVHISKFEPIALVVNVWQTEQITTNTVIWEKYKQSVLEKNIACLPLAWFILQLHVAISINFLFDSIIFWKELNEILTFLKLKILFS